MAYGDLKVRNLIWNTGSGDNTVVLSTLATQSYVTTNFAPKSNPTFTGTINGADLILSGNLTVNGTQTIINTQTLDVEDKQIEIGKVSSPSDTTADQGGIKLKGATDKTFLWVNATDAWTSSEHIHIPDNKKLLIGTGSDLSIYHSSSNGQNTIKSINGRINFNAAETRMEGADGSELIGRFIENGAVELYYDNSKKLETISWGVDCQGNTRTSGDFVCVDNGKFRAGNGSDLQIWHDGSNSFLLNNTGNLYIQGDSSSTTEEILIRPKQGEQSARFIANGSVELYHDSNKKLETTSSGINVTGAINVNGSALSSAPTITATADGAIAANKPVRLNDDGTISEIKNTALSAATGSNTDIPHQYDPLVKASVWISSTKFILFWVADDYSDRLQAAVGTASGTSITYGSRLQISTDTSVHKVSAVYDSSIDVVLLAYNTNPSGIGGGGVIKGLTVSGTTITVNGTDGGNGDASYTVDIASDNKGGFVMQWVNKDQQWFGLAGTVTSAGAISTGSAVHIANSRTINIAFNTMRTCYDKDSDAWVTICLFSGNIDYSICTRSGTTLTETSASTPPTIISGITANAGNINIVYFETEKRFLIVGRSNSNSVLKYATPKMNAGVTALSSGGSGTLFNGEQYQGGFSAYDKGTNKAFYIYDDEKSGESDTKLLTISLNSSGAATVTSEQLGSYLEKNQAIACNAEGLVLTAIDKSDGSDVSSRLKQLAVTVSNLEGDSFIGFSTDAISNSASGTINVVGNTATLSGLTPSKKYYVQKGGTVSKAADDPSVVAGVALSSTKLLIKG